MKIVLLQDEIFLPSFAGGTKANRCLLEGFAGAGHQCLALTRALTSSPDGPNTLLAFRQEMDARKLVLQELAPDVLGYQFQGVQVEALISEHTDARADSIIRRIKGFQPDWVLVADDKRRFMLASAAAAAPGRAIPLLQTIMQLPFGPLSVDRCPAQTALMRDAPAIIVISKFMQNYIRDHSGMESQVMHLPVYGDGPFSNFGRADDGFVTMINPCPYKGVAIFQALASEFPHVSFAAVPTWGANDQVLDDLRKLPNVHLLQPSDNIDQILAKTRILLVPSLWPESFGYVVPEAMLRGIPVLASDLGGLPEAKLGVEYLLPVAPAERQGNSYVSPPQCVQPWSRALAELLDDARVYASCSRRSREAALTFVEGVSVAPFERMFSQLSMRSKPAIAIVDAYSSGSQLAREVKSLGHGCWMVQSAEPIPAMYRSSFHAEDFDTIVRHRGDLAQTCESLRAGNVGLVVAGCEMGVELADQISQQLNLVSNGTNLSRARRNKALMVEALRKRGIRTPASYSSADLGSVKSWVRAQASGPVVLKPICSSASDSVFVCRTEAEVESAFQVIMGRTDVFGATNEAVLVQEYLVGTEFAVDTVSCQGNHKVVAYWQYGKNLAVGASVRSDSVELLPFNSSLHRRLFPYVASVLDALEVTNGPAHCELILSDQDPVIVEIGARLNGGNNPMLSQLCGGASQIDETLDAYLNPQRFLNQLEEPYRLSKRAMRVFLMPRETGRLRAAPCFDEIKRLDSFHELRFSAKPGQVLARIAGWVLLVHQDRDVLVRDLEEIRRRETMGLYPLAISDAAS